MVSLGFHSIFTLSDPRFCSCLVQVREVVRRMATILHGLFPDVILSADAYLALANGEKCATSCAKNYNFCVACCVRLFLLFVLCSLVLCISMSEPVYMSFYLCRCVCFSVTDCELTCFLIFGLCSS